MLALGETGELLRTDSAGQLECVGQLAMPFPLYGVALLPVVLLGGGELFLVIRLRLGCGERFRDIQHGNSSSFERKSLLLAAIVRDDCFGLYLLRCRRLVRLRLWFRRGGGRLRLLCQFRRGRRGVG